MMANFCILPNFSFLFSACGCGWDIYRIMVVPCWRLGGEFRRFHTWHDGNAGGALPQPPTLPSRKRTRKNHKNRKVRLRLGAPPVARPLSHTEPMQNPLTFYSKLSDVKINRNIEIFLLFSAKFSQKMRQFQHLLNFWNFSDILAFEISSFRAVHLLDLHDATPWQAVCQVNLSPQTPEPCHPMPVSLCHQLI